jgi:hypothetical protein
VAVLPVLPVLLSVGRFLVVVIGGGAGMQAHRV